MLKSSIPTRSSVTIKPILFLVAIITVLPITFIITYSLAIKLGHEYDRTVPYISDTIDFAPESCIGTFSISIISFITIFVVLIKHLILKNNIIENFKIGASSTSSLLNGEVDKYQEIKFFVNRFSTTLGVASGISMHGVSSFQYHNANVVHQIFASMFFFTGFLYIVTQTYLDDRFSKLPKRISIPRKILIIITISFIGYIIAQFYFDNLAAIFEIVSALSIFIYYSTFFYEFSKINLNIKLKNQILVDNNDIFASSLLQAQQ